MKILISGEKGYIGKSFESWARNWGEKYSVEYISLRSEEWKNKSLAEYNIIIHAAAIVHQKETSEMEALYSKINRDFTIEFASKAKYSGVQQFIFMSSMSVYGLEGNVGKEVVIDENTPCHPKTFYGKSKLQAEKGLKELTDENFKVAIIRSPMIYGPSCPGNYRKLKKFVMKSPIFPLIENRRSMIFIDNLSEFIRLLIDYGGSGLFFPQNRYYVNTADLAKTIAEENSKKIHLSKSLARIVKWVGYRTSIVQKLFGNLVIDSRLSDYRGLDYCVTDFKRSISLSERKQEE